MSNSNDKGSMTVSGSTSDPGSQSPRGNSGGSGNTHSGGGNTSGNINSASLRSIGDKMARSSGLQPVEFISYFIEENIMYGLSKVAIVEVNGDISPAWVELGPVPADLRNTSNSKDIIAQANSSISDTYQADISDTRIAVLKKIIDDNANLANSTQAGRRITAARNKSWEAKNELGIIHFVRQKRHEKVALAEARARAEAEARAKAEAEARARLEALLSYIERMNKIDAEMAARYVERERIRAEMDAKYELFETASVIRAPSYTPEMVSAAEDALNAAGVMSLNKAPATVQLSLAGRGVWGGTGDTIGFIEASISSALRRLIANSFIGIAGVTLPSVSLLLWSTPAGEGSAKVPDRDIGAMFALNAQNLIDKNIKIEPGVTSVSMPVRGNLVWQNQQLALQLLKTDDISLSATVPVLNAIRDNITGLDLITVPAVPGAPSRTILVNPAPMSEGEWDTGNQNPQVPLNPILAGVTVNPVDFNTTIESIRIGNRNYFVQTPLITATPIADIKGLQDFIYWRPDAAGTGVEPVYVVLSNPYGETNATGKYSGRDYNTDKAGGPIQELDWKTALIEREGVDKVKLHVGRFEEAPENAVMIDRLEKILTGELQVSDTDKRFYTHEIRELERYRALGIADVTVPENCYEVWNNTHTATLEDFKLSSDEKLLYVPESLNSQNKY